MARRYKKEVPRQIYHMDVLVQSEWGPNPRGARLPEGAHPRGEASVVAVPSVAVRYQQCTGTRASC